MNDDTELLFFKILPKHAIWGGREINRFFGYQTPPKTGQVWAFSAQKNNSTICQNGKFKGLGLDVLWKKQPQLFGSSKPEFPFIISLVAPSDNLSVQVHPTDKIARQMGYKHGKDEAWLLLKTKPNSSLIYGSKFDVSTTIKNLEKKNFTNLFRSFETHTGDFFYIPSGTIHGLGKGNITYEVQQSTDITLRIYDYNRKENEKPRHLDVDEAIESIKDADSAFNTTKMFMRPKQLDILKNNNIIIHEYIHNNSFTITKVVVNGKCKLVPNKYWLTTVSAGQGKINDINIKFSDNFIVPANCSELSLKGNFELLITSEDHVINEKKGGMTYGFFK